MQSHEHYMQRALELASRGDGCTSPNPLVGSVVVRDGRILGEGWHAIYGEEHAEVNALNDALRKFSGHGGQNSETDAGTHSAASQAAQPPEPSPPNPSGPLAGATIYVTLEPCNHHGLTPPCTQAILQAGISRVVYALADPNPMAAGGARYLREQGVEVIDGVLEAQARFQNRFFLSYLANRRPFVIAKSATSLDGRIATHTGESQWITGPESRQRAHQLRQAVDAIIVGADTVIADDPLLSTRLPAELCTAENIRHPIPVILDSTGRVPLTAKLLNAHSPARQTLIATSAHMPEAHRALLESRGLDVIRLAQNSSGRGIDPDSLLDALGQRRIQSVLLEGGASVHGSFRDAGLIDEVWTFMAPILIGGEQAPSAYAAAGSQTLGEATRLYDVRLETLGSDVLVRGLVERDVQFESGLPGAVSEI